MLARWDAGPTTLTCLSPQSLMTHCLNKGNRLSSASLSGSRYAPDLMQV